MKKVFILAPSESWIVDRFVKEWNEDNSDISTNDPNRADVIWLMADWCWERIPYVLLKTRKVITTIHHIVPEKFSAQALREFAARDEVTTAYHVPNEYTQAFISKLTTKPIHVINYWANQKIWRRTHDKALLRKKHGLPESAFIIGSFQRDTEGSDLKSPKLEKGPDLLADFIQQLSKEAELHVLLAGWRRQYIISRLEEMSVKFTYLERPSQEVLNELYQTIDLYPVTARQEGGPQSLIECGLHGINVISRPIGIANMVLKSESINLDVSLATPSVPNVEGLRLPHGYEPYRKLIQSL